MVVPKLRFKGFTGEWDKIKLSQIADIIKDKNDGAEHPVMMLSAVKGFINQQEKYSKDNAGSSLKKYTLLRRGDLAYNRGNSKLKKYGCIFELENSSALVPYVYHCFRMKNGNSTFYGNYLNSGKIDKELRGIISSSARMDGLLNVSEKDFVNILVSKPILSEQQKIADFLTTFDKRITAQQNIVADLEETKKGLLQKIFSQEIRFKDDNGQDYPDWEEKRIKDLGEIVTGNTPSTKVKSYYENGTILWVTPTDISDEMYIFDTERKLTSLGINKAHFLPKGSVLITCIASIGKMTILGEDGSCNQQINAIIPNSDNDSIFILSLLRTLVPVMFIFAGKTATPIINKKTFSRIKCFVPCLAEQQKIADFLSTFDKKITAEKQVLSDLQEIKKGLLQQMFV